MKDASLSVRPYVDADWPAICRIHDRARVVELRSGRVDPAAFRTMEEAAEEDEFFHSETLVAERNGDVVGFVSWNGDYVTWLYVDPDHHRRGVATRLVAAALERIGPQAWTNALGGNVGSLTVFRRAGMDVVFTRDAKCLGHPCRLVRLALPTSAMHDPDRRRARSEAPS